MMTLTKPRITSIDFLKGLVMVVMALDHIRDYFHYSAFYFDPIDPAHTTWPIYFTRFITNYCAPAFSFLAGLSAFMVGKRKSKKELAGFLVKRGLWLVFIELTIVNFAWYFDIHFHSPGLLVIWALGISMIVLAALIYLPRKIILIFSVLLIFGHDLFDGIHFPGNYLWAILHDLAIFTFSEKSRLYIFYPLIPWIAVMSLGYCFGPLYNDSFDSNKRKKILNSIGAGAILLFIILRAINVYGDPVKWVHFNTASQTLMSFFNVHKYPPSLLYLLITLGPSLIFLANTEQLKGRVVNFFSTFGRVPFFYYILHLYAVHLVALLFAQLSGYGWQKMILGDWVTALPSLKGYGFSLAVVYLVWFGIIALLYPLCKKFDHYKQSHKEKWWLSYL
jgi:uncharacterized membrane protein